MRKLSVLLSIMLVLCLPALAEDLLPEKTSIFAKHFVEGDDAALQTMMSAEMQEAMTAKVTSEVREQMLAEGAFKSLGEPWLEGVSSGFRRYRIPLHLEGISYDLRIVFDSEGLVAGFFRTAHTEPTEDKVAKIQDAAPDYLGHWEGDIVTPGGKLGVLVDIGYEDGYWSGEIDIPTQGAKGLLLSSFEVPEDGGLQFAIADVPGKPTFRGKIVDGVFKGGFMQAGQTMTFELLRGEAPKANRPQTPKPPYPYLEEEVTFENGDVTLAGTLTIPKGEGPFPAVALVTGSGPQDRNEEIFEHKPFMVLADHLSRAGIAVLRYDDRGTGESGGTFGTSTSETFMTDALAAVSFLAEQERIDKKRVGIAGHSEGGLIAPMAAARSKDVAFIVIMAGPGVPGKEILVRQVGLLSKAAGVDDETAASIQSAQQRALDLITEGADTETVRAQIKKLVETQMGAETAGLEQTVDRSMLELTSPWFRYFLGYDPRHDLEKLKKIPVLALNGEKDLQVDPKQNLPEIEKALKKAENKDVTIVELPSLNHLFQTADSGAVSEYYTIEETMSPKALDLIRDWIAERFQ
jgi:hypothetical protein